MTLMKLIDLLEATGYPVAFSHFKDTPSIPYITYTTPDTENFHADNKTYQKVTSVDIELYTDKKDLVAEKAIENLLDEHEIAWESTQRYIESEDLFQKIYEIGVV
ncbi:hypothetical protein ACTNEO_19930 [Gracilibacillus sp. HCP3S3_G5_1]|uniref:hypothetical protein n=1 Tax=unclassified Gracilibacillus TaxID=2625209 RepID=UPI003F8CC772